MRIWKYPFLIDDVFTLQMPRDAQVIHVAEQHGVPCLWAFVDSTNQTVAREFAVVGTGNPAPPPWEARHVGSFLTGDGVGVWHVFERTNRSQESS